MITSYNGLCTRRIWNFQMRGWFCRSLSVKMGHDDIYKTCLVCSPELPGGSRFSTSETWYEAELCEKTIIIAFACFPTTSELSMLTHPQHYYIRRFRSPFRHQKCMPLNWNRGCEPVHLLRVFSLAANGAIYLNRSRANTSHLGSHSETADSSSTLLAPEM